MIGRLLSWMEHVEDVVVGVGIANPSGDTSKSTISVGSTFDELSVDELLVFYEDTESEVNADEASMQQLAALTKQLIDESRGILLFFFKSKKFNFN